MVKNIQKNQKMNVLYLTNKPIYPLVDGGCVAMSAFLNHLINVHEKVDHLTVSTYKHPFEKNIYKEVLGDKVQVYFNYVNTKISVIKAFINLFSSSSYNVIRFYDKNLENKLIELLQNNYKVIYIESIFLLPYLSIIRNNSKAKVILRAPNIEHVIWEKYAKNVNNPFKKLYLNYLSKKLKKYELSQLKQVEGILSISNVDVRFLKLLNVQTPILHLPFAIKTEVKCNIKTDHYFFIGAYNWKPNLDAVMYLIQILFPKILAKHPNSKLHIAGSYTPENLYKYQNESITIHGKVSSVKDFMKNNGILLAPIFSGSGVRIKILEALSYGIPVIGSQIALQGISSKACFIAKNEHDYIEYIEDLKDGEIELIQKEAIEYIDMNYHPTEIEKKLNAFVTSC